MKKFFLLSIGFMFTAVSFAQAPAKSTSKKHQSPEERAKFLTEKMTAELQLTEAQKEQVYTINLGIAQKNEGILASNFTEEQKKEIIRSNQEARIEMLKNVLTAAQFEELRKEMKEQRQERMQEGGKAHQDKHE
jgi:Spy/CpxP family protein refolding chaperone